MQQTIDITEKIDEQYNSQTGDCLLGNHEFTEEEYSWMIDSVAELCKDINNGSLTVKEKRLIFTTLVEIAKHWKETDNNFGNEEKSGFWNFVFRYLLDDENNRSLLYHTFTTIISNIGNNIPIVQSGHRYYATLMMHSFAPKKSIFTFFDLCYNVFKSELDFGFTSNDYWICEVVADELRNVLRESDYREDKKINIGSRAYTITIGLRSFALHKDLSQNFVEFINSTFDKINKLYNGEEICNATRIDRYISEWWKTKIETESEPIHNIQKKRVATVTKQNIDAKYICNDNMVFLCIPPIRLDNRDDLLRLLVYVNDKVKCAEVLGTKRGELLVSTKQKEIDLNDLLKEKEDIRIKIEIADNQNVIFDSETNKSTSLNREFILFDEEKELFSHINKPTNYFVYSTDIDALKSKPNELSTCSKNLYNIYPNAGESLKGNFREVLFVDQTKTSSLGKDACLIGSIPDVEWKKDEISFDVYKDAVKLMIPEGLNLKALELRVNDKAYKLHHLQYEQKESNCYQFGLKNLGLIEQYCSTTVSLYSYEKERMLLEEKIIIFPDIDIHFDKPLYYGDSERTITINDKKISWDEQDIEVFCALNAGRLIVKVPKFKWRINDKEWHNKPINRKIWYKDFLQNGDLIEINCPLNDDSPLLFCKIDSGYDIVSMNQNGKFEIGRKIYANEGKTNISVYCIYNDKRYSLFNVTTKEYFIDNPISYNNGKVYWNVENTFVGDHNNDFLIDFVRKDEVFRYKTNGKNKEIPNIKEDFYKVCVKIKDKNLFASIEQWNTLFEGSLKVGEPERFRFTGKRIVLLNAKCYTDPSNWHPFKFKYIIDQLQYIKEEGNLYYCGRLCLVYEIGKMGVLNTMKNAKMKDEQINPVRIELRDVTTLWLVADFKGGNDYLGSLFYDKGQEEICNKDRPSKVYDEIILFKFKVEEDV